LIAARLLARFAGEREQKARLPKQSGPFLGMGGTSIFRFMPD
jgi:hypothetical protein